MRWDTGLINLGRNQVDCLRQDHYSLTSWRTSLHARLLMDVLQGQRFVKFCCGWTKGNRILIYKSGAARRASMRYDSFKQLLQFGLILKVNQRCICPRMGARPRWRVGSHPRDRRNRYIARRTKTPKRGGRPTCQLSNWVLRPILR